MRKRALQSGGVIFVAVVGLLLSASEVKKVSGLNGTAAADTWETANLRSEPRPRRTSGERRGGPGDALRRQTVTLGPLDRSFTLAVLIGGGSAIRVRISLLTS